MVRIKGKWRYLYRAVDSTGATLDFLLSAKQDAAAAKRFLAKALCQQNHPAPREAREGEEGSRWTAVPSESDTARVSKLVLPASSSLLLAIF
jgi:hypothetical protein